MKITDTFLYIPPYLSTRWEHIDFLKSASENGKIYLIIGLKSHLTPIVIPDLPPDLLEKIFLAHLQFLEGKKKPLEQEQILLTSLSALMSGLLKMQQEPSSDLFQSIMQHNPEQSDIPTLPPNILAKLIEVTKDIPEMTDHAKPDPLCHCIFCQIVKEKQAQKEGQELDQEEEVTMEDLHFRNYHIQEISSKLYQVKSVLDEHETYNVYLGDPIGCTCGEHHCEHVKAVLES